jgi:phosphoribulokinase
MAIAISVIGDASAGEGRFGRLFRGRAFQAVPRQAQYESDQQHRYNREELNQYYREMYPRYYGGFHARTLQNYGYAPGDIGFRGGLSYPGMAW